MKKNRIVGTPLFYNLQLLVHLYSYTGAYSIIGACAKQCKYMANVGQLWFTLAKKSILSQCVACHYNVARMFIEFCTSFNFLVAIFLPIPAIVSPTCKTEMQLRLLCGQHGANTKVKWAVSLVIEDGPTNPPQDFV